MRKYLFFIGLSSVSMAHPALAAGDTPAPVITVTANALDTPVSDTGQSVTVIDSAEIDTVQGADLTRILDRVPGVSITRNGGTGSFTGLSIRGAGSEQVLVLVDGVPVADPASPSGGFDFGNVLAGMAGTIDITRGSNSVVWGSDAIGGVVDIETRRDKGLAASAEYGSRDSAYLRGNGGIAGKGYYAGLAGSYYRTNGFSAAASGTEPDGFDQLALGGSAFVDVTSGLEVFARGEWSLGHLDIDGFPPPAYQLADTGETQRTRRYSGATGFNYYGNALTLHGSYSLADTARDYFDPSQGSAPTFASDGRSQQVMLRGEYRLVGGMALAFGGEHEWSDYATTYDAPAGTHSTGGYLQLGGTLGNLAAHIGGRVDDHQRFGTHFTYGADASYAIGGGWRVKASLGEGFKAPTLFQLYSYYGNADLQPEQSTSMDLGVEHGQRGRGAHFALTAFRRDSDRLIGFTYTAARPYGVYDNIGRARAQGLEAEAGFDLAPQLRIAGVYSYIDATDRTTGKALARRPHHVATLYADWDTGLASHDGEGFALGADMRVASHSYDDAANAVRLGGYAVLDLRASLPLPGGLVAFARIENAFDRHYQTAAGYASTPRGVFAGVRASM